MPWVPDPSGSGMLTWEPVQLPQELLDHLLDCLRVPLERREFAVRSLRGLFSLAEEWHRFDLREQKRTEAREQLARLAQKAATFRSELAALEDVARVWLGVHALRRERFGETGDPPDRRMQINDLLMEGGHLARERYERLCDVVEEIRASSTEDFWADCAPQSKAPFGRNGTAFEEWFCVLCLDADREGWHLTVSPEDGTGTMKDFLELARPHLPASLVPKRLDLKRLKRLREAYVRGGQSRPPK